MRSTVVTIAVFLTTVGTSKDESCNDIVKKAILSLGGLAKLEKLQNIYVTTSGTVWQGGKTAKFAMKAWYTPDKSRQEITYFLEGRNVSELRILNNDKGWVKDGEMRVASKDELLAMQRGRVSGHASLLFPLIAEGTSFSLAREPDQMLDGNETWVIRVKGAFDHNEKIYITKKDHMLVKAESTILGPDQHHVKCERIFSDYGDVQGARTYMKAAILFDGKKHLESRFEEIKILDKIDPSLFVPEQGRAFTYDRAKTGGGVTWSYDALGRRISDSSGRDFYFTAGWQVVEERVSGTARISYVWSPVYVDAMIARDWDSDSNGSLETRHYVQQDANWNVTALVTTAGVVAERYVYDPFGSKTRLTAAWAAPGSDTILMKPGYQGHFEILTGVLDFRGRIFSATLGRFMQNDPLGFGGGQTSLVMFVGNGPVGGVDPLGLQTTTPAAEAFKREHAAGQAASREWLKQFGDDPKAANGKPRDSGVILLLGSRDTSTAAGEKYFADLGFGRGAVLTSSQMQQLARDRSDSVVIFGGLFATGIAARALAAAAWPYAVSTGQTTVATAGRAVVAGWRAIVAASAAAKEKLQQGASWVCDRGAALCQSLANLGPRLPRSCFPAGTAVHTSVGLKPIEQIVAGERVWAYDHQQLRWAEREVIEVYQLLHRGTMTTLQVKGETLRATGGHPFWVVRGEDLANRPKPVRIKPYEAGGRQEGRWVLARDLRAGDEVLLRQGEVVALEFVQLDDVEERVYNFHVAELQNYSVGVSGVLVHNTNDPVLPPNLIGRLEAAEVQGHIAASEHAAILQQSQQRMQVINRAWDRAMEVVNSNVEARSPEIRQAAERMEAILAEIIAHTEMLDRLGRIPIRP